MGILDQIDRFVPKEVGMMGFEMVEMEEEEKECLAENMREGMLYYVKRHGKDVSIIKFLERGNLPMEEGLGFICEVEKNPSKYVSYVLKVFNEEDHIEFVENRLNKHADVILIEENE